MLDKKDTNFLGYLVSENEVVNMTQKQFHDLLKVNTDENFHSENIVYIAYRSGNQNYIQEAENILWKHEKAGSLNFELSEKRNVLFEKIIDLFLPTYQKTIKECL
tara:strand:- start:765 stop:1079 length:315 start_codon:yes stop_codon:yes gene_type:complete